MATTSESVSVVKDLVEIVNDRIEGYERATKDVEMSDTDLKMMFSNLIQESRSFREELQSEVLRLGGEPEKGTTISGQIHKAWMDLKAAVTGHDREAILESCHFGDSAAIAAYEKALADEDTPTDLKSMLARQLRSIEASRDRIGTYLRSASASR